MVFAILSSIYSIGSIDDVGLALIPLARAQHEGGHAAGHQGGAYRGIGRAGRGKGGGHFAGGRPSEGRHIGRPNFIDDAHHHADNTVEEKVFHSGGHRDSLTDIHDDSHEGGPGTHGSDALDQGDRDENSG
jgi:hypothetical protein